MKHLFILGILMIIFLFSFRKGMAQDGKIIQVSIQSKALENNLLGDSSKKNILVYLPPNYGKNLHNRYPVLYLLHGFGGQIGAKSWFSMDSIVQLSRINRMISDKIIRPFIIVMPDGHNKLGGAFYTNSIATGNWEDYVYQEVVKLIDSSFRTIPSQESRGIAGHSMGGYGALKIAMKHPDVFSSVYASSACCLGISTEDNDYSAEDIDRALAASSWEDFSKLEFFSRAIIANAASWSPNPAKAPFFADLPFGVAKNADQLAAQFKMTANLPLWMIEQNVSNLKRLKAISFDVGNQEEAIQRYNVAFSKSLSRNGVAHQFYIFKGGHVNQLKKQFENFILPFFSKNLKF